MTQTINWTWTSYLSDCFTLSPSWMWQLVSSHRGISSHTACWDWKCSTRFDVSVQFYSWKKSVSSPCHYRYVTVIKNYKCFYFLILLFSKIKRKYLAIPCLLMLWFDLLPQKSGSYSLDSAKPPGVRGNWWLFGSFLECEMLFSTGFMSSEAWELPCLKGLGNAG